MRKRKCIPAWIFGGLAAIAIGASAPGTVRAQVKTMEIPVAAYIANIGNGRASVLRDAAPPASGYQAATIGQPVSRKYPVYPGADIGNPTSALPPGAYTASGSPGNAAGVATSVADTHY